MGQTKDKKEIVLKELNKVRKEIHKTGELNQEHEYEDENLKILIKVEVNE